MFWPSDSRLPYLSSPSTLPLSNTVYNRHSPRLKWSQIWTHNSRFMSWIAQSWRRLDLWKQQIMTATLHNNTGLAKIWCRPSDTSMNGWRQEKNFRRPWWLRTSGFLFTKRVDWSSSGLGIAGLVLRECGGQSRRERWGKKEKMRFVEMSHQATIRVGISAQAKREK